MRLGMERAGKAPDFSAGNETSVEIRQKNILRALHLRVRGNIVVTGGTGAGNYHADAAYRIAKRIKVDWDGQERQSYYGTDLATLEALFLPVARVQTFPTSLAAATYPFDVIYALPFFLPGVPFEQSRRFALPTKLVDAPLLSVEWGEAEDLAYGDDGALTFSGVSVELYEQKMMATAPPIPGAYFPLLLNNSQYRLLADVSDEVHELPSLPGGRELVRVIATALNNGASDEDYRRSDAVLTKLGLNVNGVDEIDPIPASVIQRENAVLYDLAAVRTGVYVLDAAADDDARPNSVWTIERGLRPYVTFDGDYDSGAGQHLIRFLAMSTDGRIGVR